MEPEFPIFVDMAHFEEAIVDLLLRHNCVIVPTFGGFVAQSTNAVVDMRNGVMLPPSKSVLFNRQLLNNDGLLIQYLAEKHDESFDAASLRLKEKVQHWNQTLKDGRRVTIDRIGYLYLDSERNISFEQDRFINLLLQSYGLNKVHFLIEEDVKRVEHKIQPEKEVVKKPIAKKEIQVDWTPREVPMPEGTPEPAAKILALNEEDGSDKRRAWKYLAAAALLPIAFYTYWIPMKTSVLESGVVSSKDFNPYYHAGEGVYQKKGFSFSLKKEKEDPTLDQSLSKLPNTIDVYFYKYAEDLYIPVKVESPESKEEVTKGSAIVKTETVVINKLPPKVETKPVIVPTPKPIEQAVAKKETNNPAKKEEKALPPVAPVTRAKMEFIVGCFSNETNANELVKELRQKGFAAHVLPAANGLYRVSSGGTNVVEKMDAIIGKSKDKGYDGWLLK